MSFFPGQLLNAVGLRSTIYPHVVSYSNASWDITAVVTITEISGGVFGVDQSAAVFTRWGISDETETFGNVCEAYTMVSKVDQYGYALDFTVTNNGDGTITVDWINENDNGTHILTPKE